MRLIRLFADAPLRTGDELALPATAAAHAIRVLRLRPGDPVTLFNGDGHDYRCTLLAVDRHDARVRIEAAAASASESPLRLTLVQAIARGEKMDWIVQKATELGVERIVPVATRRSEVRLDAARAGKRAEHWRAVAIAACEQCGRGVLPRIDPPASLAAWLASAQTPDPMRRLVLSPGATTKIRDLGPLETATLAVGPEGGFDDDDLAAMQGAGFEGLSLGPRVLRTETAGITAIAALQAHYGDL